MLQEKISNTYISKSRIIFQDEYGNHIPYSDQIDFWANPIISLDKTSPDFYIRGFFKKVDHYLKTGFFISSKGPDVLFITGVPNDTSPDIFRFMGTKFSSFYKDDHKGILFQILPVAPTYRGISKQFGVKQFQFNI